MGRALKMAGASRRKRAPSCCAVTPLGKRLAAIRVRILVSGQPLFGWDEVEREVQERRGQARGAGK